MIEESTPKEVVFPEEAVLFVGAGISRKVFGQGRSPLPGWWTFVKNFLDFAKQNGYISPGDLDDFDDLLKKNKLPILAQSIIDRIPQSLFSQFIRDSFTPKYLAPALFHRIAVTIPYKFIITTNYDNLLEQAYFEAFREYPKVFTHLDFKNGIPDIPDGSIIKIHGDINSVESIVLGNRSYTQIIHASPHYKSFMHSVFSNMAVEFVGYGLEDPDMDELLDSIGFNNESRWIHVAHFAEGTKNKIEIERLLKDRSISVREYPAQWISDSGFNPHLYLDVYFHGKGNYLVHNGINLKSSLPKMLVGKFTILNFENTNEDADYLLSYLVARTARVYQRNIENTLESDFEALTNISSLPIILSQTSELENIDNIISIFENKSIRPILIVIGDGQTSDLYRFRNNCLSIIQLPHKFTDVDLEGFRILLESQINIGGSFCDSQTTACMTCGLYQDKSDDPENINPNQ